MTIMVVHHCCELNISRSKVLGVVVKFNNQTSAIR
jgi:hypothetical protein